MKTLNIFFILSGCISILNGQLIDLNRDLIAHYPFDGNAQDISEYANHGIVHGPVLTQDRFGNVASAYYFDGIDDYISVADADILSFPDQEVSIVLWVKPLNPGHSFMLYKGSTANNREYAFGIREDTLASIHINNNGSNVNQSGAPSITLLNLNEWYHLVGIWDGNHLSIYINGILENRITHNVIIGNFDSDLFIGAYGGSISQYAFHGTIDDIYIYSRVINECEIDALFTGEIFEER